ncbi:MAG: type 1 glutamine amidotransferase [Desulfomonilaceae bacterium]
MKRLASLIILVGILTALFIEVMMNLPTKELKGILIDLEFGQPDPARHRALREALTERLGAPCDGVKCISLRYVHFSHILERDIAPQEVDFILLSPQGVPWHVYEREFQTETNRCKQLLTRAIMDYHIPALGICGGHQFLALAFGGTVGFIDERLEQQKPDRYPKQGLAEKGEVALQTLAEDPLWQGIVAHPGAFFVMENHFEEVKTLPPAFRNLARSSLSEIQVLKLPSRLVYGFAFHPERGWDSALKEPTGESPGKKLLRNFFSMALDEKEKRRKNPPSYSHDLTPRKNGESAWMK